MRLGLRNNLFLRNSVISASGSLLAGVFNYLFHFVISRRLSVGQYGELQALFASATILSVFVTAISYFAEDCFHMYQNQVR